MPKYTYGGNQTVVFSHYLDVTDPDAPKTLTAEPGQTYDIKQAEGHRQIQPDGQFTEAELPMPPDGDWRSPEDKPFDPGDHDVPAVLDYLDDADHDEALRVLNSEAAGKNRKGVVDQREAILDSKKES